MNKMKFNDDMKQTLQIHAGYATGIHLFCENDCKSSMEIILLFILIEVQYKYYTF